MSKVLLILAILTLPVAALGSTHYFNPDGSGDFPTIQAGLQQAAFDFDQAIILDYAHYSREDSHD